MEILHKESLQEAEVKALIGKLEERFTENMHRHPEVHWEKVESYLRDHPTALLTVYKMEMTGGQPDVLELADEIAFVCCVKETPKERKSLCYDQEARVKRKKYPPASSAKEQIDLIGGNLLTEADYKQLQELERVDEKTSTWLETPTSVRQLGGALFGDCRYGRVFIYHNGAESYYQVRGYRAKLGISLLT